MDIGQIFLVLFFGIFAFSAFVLGFRECRRNNPGGLTPVYNIIGAFVWADTVVFGLFWTIVSFVSIMFHSILLFFTALSIFWLVRSVGETVYWLNEQFAATKRNKPETLWHSRIFPGTSSYIASQIFWQCMTVIFSITTIYLLKEIL